MMRNNRILTTLRRFYLLSVVTMLGTLAANAAWDGNYPATIADAGITGTGLSSDPYVIQDEAGFAYFTSVMNENTSYWQVKDNVNLDMGNKTLKYCGSQSVFNFRGHFDGQGTTISNVKFGPTNEYGNRAVMFTGLFGRVYGSVTGVAVDHVTFVEEEDGYRNQRWGESWYGVIACEVNGGTISKCKVNDATFSFGSSNMQIWGGLISVGGLVGNIKNKGKVTDCKVTTISINTGTANATNTNLFVGGLVGFVESVGNLSLCGTSNATITVNNVKNSNGFSVGHIAVGGVIGNIEQPVSSMPSDLCAHNPKLKSFRGSVGPVCGMFLKKSGTSNATVSDDYSAENISGLSTTERAKADAWMFTGYQLGVDDDYVTGSISKNYNPSDISNGYLPVGDPKAENSKLPKQNSVNGNARNSRTLLWYTKVGSQEQNTATSQSVNPGYGTQWGAAFPNYYCYFMQGYNVGTYVAPGVAENFIEGLAKVSKSTIFTIYDEDLGQRGLYPHTIKLKVVQEGDNNSSVTYTCSVNGVTQTGNADDGWEIAPNYDGPVTVIVNSSEGKVASVTLPRATLPTLYSPRSTALSYNNGSGEKDYQAQAGVGTENWEKINYDNLKRGSAENPYVISSEKELRLWSEYSHLENTVENGYKVDADGNVSETYQDGANNFNTSYFILANDIRFSANSTAGLTEVLKNRNGGEVHSTEDNFSKMHKFNPVDHFEPIGSLNADERYDLEHTFRGYFDGRGHVISGMHQIWDAGRLDMEYGEQATMSWGLFGVVGGDKNHRAVIKNVIIDDAWIEHNVHSGSFFYLANTKQLPVSDNSVANDFRGSNAAIGVLAGMVTNYSTISNIDIRRSHIYSSAPYYPLTRTDWTCIDVSWKQAYYHLWAGGVIGRVQAAYDVPRGDLGGTISLSNMSVDIDLDLSIFTAKGGWNKNGKMMEPNDDQVAHAGRLNAINLGGIVGSIFSTAGASSVPWPENVFFTGQHRAMMATAGIGFGYVSYGGISENVTNAELAHQHWCGPSGIGKSIYYNNYFIRLAKGDEEQWNYTQVNKTDLGIGDKGAWRNHASAGMLWEGRSCDWGRIGHSTLIDGGRVGTRWIYDNYIKKNNHTFDAWYTSDEAPSPGQLWYIGPLTPEKPKNPAFDCGHSAYSGVRSILSHNESSLPGEDDLAGYYQGINHGTWKDWSELSNQQSVLADFDKNSDFVWNWDDETGRPVMTPTHAEHLDVTQATGESGTVLTADLKGVDDTSSYEYAWFDANCYPNWKDTDGNVLGTWNTEAAHGTTNNIGSAGYDRYYYAVAAIKSGNTVTKYYKSKIIKVPGTMTSISVEGDKINYLATPVSADSYGNNEADFQKYIAIRTTQQEYYSSSWTKEQRLKSDVSYYKSTMYSAWMHDMRYALIGRYWDPTNKVFGNLEDYSNSNDYELIESVSYAHIEDAWLKLYDFAMPADSLTYAGYFANETTPKADIADTIKHALIRIPAIYYDYKDYIARDKRTGDFDKTQTNNGYRFSFEEPTDNVSIITKSDGLSWPNRGLTYAQYTALGSDKRDLPAGTKNTLSVTLNPSETQLTASGFTVTYRWYNADGDSIPGEHKNVLQIINRGKDNLGNYECRVTVYHENECNHTNDTVFTWSSSVNFGRHYIYIRPEGGSESMGGSKPNDSYTNDFSYSGTIGVGNDENDGSSPRNPVKTWSRAYSLLDAAGSWEENYIVLIGPSDYDNTREGFGLGSPGGQGGSTGTYEAWYNRGASKFMNRNATITTYGQSGWKFGGKFIMGDSGNSGQDVTTLYGDTRFENITLACSNQNWGAYAIIFAQYHNLEMGEGVQMANFPSARAENAGSGATEVGPLPGTMIADLQIFGGCNNDQRFVKMPGSVSNYEVDDYMPHPEGFTMTFKSGFYSNISVTGRQSNNNDQNGIAGTPNRPIKCKIVVDIDRDFNNNHNNFGYGYANYDVGAVLAGNHEGAQYGDVDIVIASGIVGRVSSGSLGCKRGGSDFGTKGGFRVYGSYYGTKYNYVNKNKYTPDKDGNVYQPFDAYFGRCNILVDPKLSSDYKKNSPMLDEAANLLAVVGEIYGGALSRMHESDAATRGYCMSTFYGKTNITINGGTFDINCPADDATMTNTDRTKSGKYGLNAFNNASRTDNGRTFYWAQPGIYAAGAGGFNGMGSDELHTNDTRLPYWFKAENIPVESNKGYPIADLRAKGVVNPDYVVVYDDWDRYKEKTGVEKVYITCTDSIRRTADGKYERYAVTKIDPAETSTTITINGGNFFPRKLPDAQGCGIYGAGNGFVNLALIPSGRQPNPLAGSLLGKPGKTAVEININGGIFNCDIFGGGKGNDYYHANWGNYNRPTDIAPYNVASDESYGMNYSHNARILGNVVMNINGGIFKQNIYGGGYGSTSDGCEYMAEVRGDVTVNLNGEKVRANVLGNVFGGGENAKVRQSTSVNLDNATVYGSVFGGGDNATVGKIEMTDVYPASDYWKASDNVYAAWTGYMVPNLDSEGEHQASEAEVNELVERNNIIRVGDASSYKEYAVGDLKPDGQRTGTATQKPVGMGRTSVYAKTNAALIYGDIYGGGNKADVNGNTYVGMFAGKVGGAIFGGGKGLHTSNGDASNVAANIHGSTEVFLNGYTVLWDKIFDIDRWSTVHYNTRSALNDISVIEDGVGNTPGYMWKWSNSTDKSNHFIGTYTVGNKNYSLWKDPHWTANKPTYNAHNVFGGGNIYSAVDSTARVTVTQGMVPKELLQTDEWENSFYENDHPHFYVFGGGYGVNTTVGNSYVNVGMEGIQYEDATTDIALAKGGTVLYDENGNPVVRENTNSDPVPDETIGIYNNGYGIADYTVLGVLGGGMEGQVINNTRVVIGGRTYIHRVYGGGYGKYDRSSYSDITGDANIKGKVGGKTFVRANGGLIKGDIFGGGARGDVADSTYVEIIGKDCKVNGSVYGGGDVASVGNSADENDQTKVGKVLSKVLVAGGEVYANVFAGGSRGPIYGSSLVNVVDTVSGNNTIIPNIYGDIYGGGEKAYIAGNSNVLIEGGLIAGDIFGGGLGALDNSNGNNTNDGAVSADIKGTANVTINGGSANWKQLCTDVFTGHLANFDNSKSLPASVLTETLTAEDVPNTDGVYDWAKLRFIKNHNIYGGGNINCEVMQGTNVVVNHGMITEGLENYDQETIHPFAVCWYRTIQNKSYPQFSVLGGGYGKYTTVTGNANVTMNVANYNATGYDLDDTDEQNQYNEYKTYRAYNEDLTNFMLFEAMLENNWLNVTDADKDLYYGGTNKNVFRRYRASRYAWSGGVHGHVMAGVYGGSWAGKIAGNTIVNVNGTSGCRNIFGGGVGMETSDASEHLGEVSGTTTVRIDGGIISGDVYGGGAGVESAKNNDGEPTIDFYNVARVVGSTDVTVNGGVTGNSDNLPYTGNNGTPIDNTLIFGNVTGGGDVANVGAYVANYNNIPVATDNDTYTTKVTINEGLIFSQVYGGGSGRPARECVDYTRLGAVYGNTKVTVNTDASEINTPWIWNRLYGGGKNGTVFGSTNVDIAGGNFGYNIFGGGYGVVDSVSVEKNTNAAVKGNTHVNVTGGLYCLSQEWLTTDENGNDLRAWRPASQSGEGVFYSPQYDPVNNRFNINHNVYGGGNACCTIGGSTYVNVTKGMIAADSPLGRQMGAGETVFTSREWKYSYDKVGSTHFTVFGAGYGDNTLVVGDTHVDVDIEGDNVPSNVFENRTGDLKDVYYDRFYDKQSLLDVVGGGYNGTVNGNTFVHIGGNTYMRRVFAGGYYAPVKGNTNIFVNSGDIDEVFGGGLIGDVYHNANLQVGWRESTTFDGKTYNESKNSNLYINKNVYGGNDVSGSVGYDANSAHTEGEGTKMKIYGGNLYGNVYGGGSGNYLYVMPGENEKSVDKLTLVEHYRKTAAFAGYDIVYLVPMRDGMMNSSYASPAQKIVNISSWRPLTTEADVELWGTSSSDKLFIKGNVFGGGYCATISGLTDNYTPAVNVRIKDHINVGGVFLGSDGEPMFEEKGDMPFSFSFQQINGNFNLEDSIIWDKDPANHGIEYKYLRVQNDDRPKVYKHLLDLYFMPVEMSIQPKVYWGTNPDGDGNGTINDATIGIFCAGGNRGNMNVEPNSDGNVVDITFPTDLVITDRIIGGCNYANKDWTNPTTGNTVSHIGGYLLGRRKTAQPVIKLLVQNKFEPTPVSIDPTDATKKKYVGGNVYGGCYYSGSIYGDVKIDLRSNMLEGLRTDYLDNAEVKDTVGLCVYGAGYGTQSFVYGDVKVEVGNATPSSQSTRGVSASPAKGSSRANANANDNPSYAYTEITDTGTSANYIFGGGMMGNVIGNTYVRYYNGHTYHSVTGGSYSGYLFGSTHILVGYPEYYEANKQQEYFMKRKDESTDNLAQISEEIDPNAADGKSTVSSIKQSIMLMKGDYVAPALYEEICDYTPTDYSGFFTHRTTSPTDAGLAADWSNVSIAIDEAIYGGGYSTGEATSSAASNNSTIVLKYTDQYNADTKDNEDVAVEDRIYNSVGYGGNTTMVVWDKLNYDGNGKIVQPGADDIDHISISKQTMLRKDLPDGTDLFGYYYKDTSGHYHYIYKENTYFQGEGEPKPVNYDGTYVSAFDFEAKGGMYGDGHLSYTQGFRTGELKGYGFSGGRTVDGAKLMNSFQRMDILRLEDCNVSMLGARDYATNATNSTPYSLSRIGEMQMVSHIDDSGALRKVSNIYNPDAPAGSNGEKGARNYIGLSNNILYVGCLWTNTPFTDTHHDYNNALNSEGTSYLDVKQKFIDDFYTIKNSGASDDDIATARTEFDKRNDATAKNMIGISSGYAMKLQNVYTTVSGSGDQAKLVDNIYYGPIVGVAEVNLISARMEEGGGYIYADNIHHRNANGAIEWNANDKHDFLMITGNFVFPHDNDNRYILDDCYTKTYDQTLGASPATDPEEMHYWYIQGYNYFYNLHITGYTSADSKKFVSDNSDVLTLMKGAKTGDQVTLHSVTWRSNHKEGAYDYCDLDGSYKADASRDKYPATMTGTVSSFGDATNNLRWNDNYYKLSIGAGKTSVYDESEEGYVHSDVSRYNSDSSTPLSATLSQNEPIIAMQLEDNVDNTTESYYKAHLSEPCMATIVLSVPAKDLGGNPIVNYTTISNILQKVEVDGKSVLDGRKSRIKGEENTPAMINMNGEYYYFNEIYHQYLPLDFDDLYVKISNDYNKVTSVSIDKDYVFNVTYEGGSAATTATNLYIKGLRDYTYTVYLTVDYVQGPEVRGHIDIENCALPGEMVRLSTKNVKIGGDQSMSPIGYYWRVGMRQKNADGDWEFVDKTPWTPATATANTTVKGYDSYKLSDRTKNGVFKGSIFDETENYLDLPVYYFMNGYGVQYGVEFNGLKGQIFPASMAEADSLLVHNFHRMDTHAPNASLVLHLSEAAARAKAYEDYTDYNAAVDKAAWLAAHDEYDANNTPQYVSPLNRPRVYMLDEDDMEKFYQFVDTVGRNVIDDENVTGRTVKLGGKEFAVPTGGKYVQFILQDSIGFRSKFYHAPKQDFEGDFDGRGYTIFLTDLNHVTENNAPALFNKVKGNVYNLGVVGRALATSVEDDNQPHIFNSFVYGRKGRTAYRVIADAETNNNTGLLNCYDLSVADVNDFKYGRVAYNLNSFYLNERYRRGKNVATRYNDWIEQYYANGDYQYAHNKDADMDRQTGYTYLREGGYTTPAYGYSATRHDKSHALDSLRAKVTYLTSAEATALNTKYDKEYDFEIHAETTGSVRKLNASPFSTNTIKSVKYVPLFNENRQIDGGGDLTIINNDGKLRNDYLIFGQNLTLTPDTLPMPISNSLNYINTNRVWRASGFYGSKKDEGFYYNAMANISTAVHDPRLTAIDFSCLRDGSITTDSYQDGTRPLSSVSGQATDYQAVYYAPTKDTPAEDDYWRFDIANNDVTQNLLVYAKSGTKSYTVVNSKIGYDAEVPTSRILGHPVAVTNAEHVNATLLHLVDKENFNAPIAFTAGRAWYDREPDMETGFVEATGIGWESISLPFTVKKTKLSEPIERFYDYKDEQSNPANKRNTKKADQDEISFFYGTDAAANGYTPGAGEDVTDNPFVLNHEYWLRATTGIKNSETGNRIIARMKRPENSQADGGFAAYTPFVVSFPGKMFYEFDMTGRTITFSEDNAPIAITDEAVVANTVTKTLESQSYSHIPTFMNEEGTVGTYAIALRENADDTDAQGDRFTSEAPVYPFRSKIVMEQVAAETGGNAKAAAQYADAEVQQPDFIFIDGLGISLEDKGIEEPETEDVIESDGLRIYPSGKRIVVESTYATTVKVYTTAGQLVRVLDVRPGTSVYSGFPSGIYVVEQKKLRLQ